MEEKKIEQWLSELPEGYRERALLNRGKETNEECVKTIYAESMSTALQFAFLWDDTPEGFNFWSQTEIHYRVSTTPLPPLPSDPIKAKPYTLSRRDYFAGLAMQALVMAEWSFKSAANQAIAHADELIKQLDEEETEQQS